jgi:hypothetical protein
MMPLLMVVFLLVPCVANSEESPPRQTDLWAEVIPFTNPNQPQAFSPRVTDSTLEFEQLPEGPALLCAGGKQSARGCEQLDVPATGTVAWDFQEGMAAHGVLLCGEEPCREAQIALVPAELRLMAPFQMPLDRTPEGNFRRQVSTDAEGQFSLPPLRIGTYRLDIRLAGGRNIHGEEFEIPQPSRRSEESAEIPRLDLGTIEIDPGLEVTFRVTDWAGQPIEEARVGGAQGESHEVPELFEGLTDSRGEAHLRGWQSQKPTQLVCHAEGFERHSATFDAPPAFFDCALVPYARIFGTVVDSQDRPISGVRVETSIPEEYRPYRRTSTDSEGHFTLESLSEGSFQITFAAPNFQPATLEVPLEPAEHRTLEPVLLEAGEPLVGTVVDHASQKLVEGALVRIVDPMGAGSVSTDESGHFELLTDLDRRLELAVTASGYAENRVWVLPRQAEEEQEPLSIELSPGGRIEILAYAADGEPCIQCRFTMQPSPSSTNVLYTDGDGRILSTPISPGEYTVARVEQQNLGAIVVVRGGRETRSARVESGKTTRVVFRAPEERLTIHFEPPPPPGWQLVARTSNGEQRVQPDLEGSFSLPWQADELLEIALEAPGLRLKHSLQAPDGPVLDLELPRTLVTGLLLRGEDVVPNQWIEWVSTVDAQLWGKARTDAHGAFRLPHLPPGLYTVRIGGRDLRTLALDPGMAQDISMKLAEPTANSR